MQGNVLSNLFMIDQSQLAQDRADGGRKVPSWSHCTIMSTTPGRGGNAGSVGGEQFFAGRPSLCGTEFGAESAL